MSVIIKETERHIVNKGLDSKSGENMVNEAWTTIQSYVSGIHTWMLVIAGIAVVMGIVAYSFAGKGEGSHAGREEVRRSYRRELAKQMARQDAEKIKRGEKERKRWMQW